mmetsp:Transcript_40579/g.89071  ORF Transcript_40579/g.89071 Transcript_40579/m.89071 type:complete len:203 (-) Transcript_40579:586-1194(-)
MPDASSSDLSAISSAEIEMASWADVRAADTRARHRVHVEAVMATASARVPPTDLVSMQRSQNHSHSGTLASGTRRQNRWYVASQPSHSSSCAESLPEPHTSHASSSSSSSRASSVSSPKIRRRFDANGTHSAHASLPVQYCTSAAVGQMESTTALATNPSGASMRSSAPTRNGTRAAAAAAFEQASQNQSTCGTSSIGRSRQ